MPLSGEAVGKSRDSPDSSDVLWDATVRGRARNALSRADTRRRGAVAILRPTDSRTEEVTGFPDSLRPRLSGKSASPRRRWRVPGFGPGSATAPPPQAVAALRRLRW